MGDIVCKDIINKLMGICHEVTYENEEIIIHEGHVPRVGLVLLEGKVEILKENSKRSLPLNKVIGIKELGLGERLGFAVKVYPNTKVLSIDKSAFIDLEKENCEDLKHFMKKCVGI